MFYFLFISPRCSLYIFPYYYIFWIICLLRGYVSNYQWINKVCYYVYDALFSFVQKVHVIIYDGINLTLQKKYNSARYTIFFIRNKKNLNKLDTKCPTISQEKLKRGYLKWNIEAHNEIFEFIYWRMIFFSSTSSSKFTSPCHFNKILFVDSNFFLLVRNVVTLPFESDFSLLDFNWRQKLISRIWRVTVVCCEYASSI